jgi:hypothetical protein
MVPRLRRVWRFLRRHPTWPIAATVLLLLGLFPPCGKPPQHRYDDATELLTAAPAGLACVRARQGPVMALACDTAGAPRALEDFRELRWLPAREGRLWRRARVRYGIHPDPARQRVLERSRRAGSVYDPIVDLERELQGWRIHDVERRIALLLVTLDDRYILALSQEDARGTAELEAALAKLSAAGPTAVLAQARRGEVETSGF